MKTLLPLVICMTTCVVDDGIGQTADLMCQGKQVFQTPVYREHIEGTTSGATHVDLGNHRIITPVGTFNVYDIDEAVILFNEPDNPYSLSVEGRLDRVTGEMEVVWHTLKDRAKLLAGQTVTPARLAWLHCSATRRLF
jgi:hypothetical protein